VLASFHKPPEGVTQADHGWAMERIFEALAPRPTLNSRPGGSKTGRDTVDRAHLHGLPAPAMRASYAEIFPPGGPSSLTAISNAHPLRPYTERLAGPEGPAMRAAIAALRRPRLSELSADYETRNHATASMARWPTVAEAAAGQMRPPAPGLPLLPPRIAQPVQQQARRQAQPAVESSYMPGSGGSSSGASAIDLCSESAASTSDSIQRECSWRQRVRSG
jgi:hypothetical protein